MVERKKRAWSPERRAQHARRRRVTAPASSAGMPARDKRQLALALERENAAGAPAEKASRSGPNIPENDRRTVAVKLRLPRAAADALHELALRSGQTLSTTVAELLRDFTERNAGERLAAQKKKP